MEYTFTAQGRRFTVEAPNKVAAYCAANQRCADMGLDLPQGVWMETTEPLTFRWAAGNFFD